MTTPPIPRPPGTREDTADAHARLLATIAERTDQGTPAPCLTSPHWEDWTAAENTTTGQKALDRAADSCRTCPVLADCAAYGLAHEEAGTWGALTPAARREIRREARKTARTTTPAAA